MKITLRDYQQATVDSIFNYLSREDGNPIAVLPTGAGKSVCIGALIQQIYDYDSKAKVLILQHQQELIEQNLEKILFCTDGNISAGIYCAGLGKKELYKKCILASIKSIHNISHKLDSIDLVIIDECHLLSPNEATMYNSLISLLKKKNNQLRVIGFSATPFRTSTGMLTDDKGIFTDICINVPIKKLIADGFLAPVFSKSGINTPDTSHLKIRKGDFLDSEVEKLYTDKISLDIYKEFLRYGSDRKSILVFCAGVEQAENFAKLLRKNGEKAECVTGATGNLFREQHLADFKKGKLRFLVNVGVLTTGFDAPNTDCLMILRATKSPGLYVQIIGRGMRIAPNKTNCLVLDFGGNIDRHGPVDLIEVRKAVKKDEKGKNIIADELFTAQDKNKLCPKCRTVNTISDTHCIMCQFEFPAKEIEPKNIVREAGQGNIVSNQFEDYEINNMEFYLHEKPGKPPIMRIEYFYSYGKSIKDYLCFQHGGKATLAAQATWKKLAKNPEVPAPTDTEFAIFSASTGDLKAVTKIRCIRQNGFLRVVAWRFKDSLINSEQEITEEIL